MVRNGVGLGMDSEEWGKSRKGGWGLESRWDNGRGVREDGKKLTCLC